MRGGADVFSGRLDAGRCKMAAAREAEVCRHREEKVMKKISLIAATLVGAAVLCGTPISLHQAQDKSLSVSVDKAQAYYGHYRRVHRRVYRRHYYYGHPYRYHGHYYRYRYGGHYYNHRRYYHHHYRYW